MGGHHLRVEGLPSPRLAVTCTAVEKKVVMEMDVEWSGVEVREEWWGWGWWGSVGVVRKVLLCSTTEWFLVYFYG